MTVLIYLFKIVDMLHGKANDDGYRGVHIYFQVDHFHYPIELQHNALYDRYLNDWLHAFVYKKGYGNENGKHLRKLYEDGEYEPYTITHSKEEFKEKAISL